MESEEIIKRFEKGTEGNNVEKSLLIGYAVHFKVFLCRQIQSRFLFKSCCDLGNESF